MNVLDAIRSKRAVREFAPAPIPDDLVSAVLDAGRQSQSSKNTQPWEFVLVTDKATLKALSETGTYAGHLAGATFAVVLVGTASGNWNSFDLGQAAAYMQLAAWEMGIGSCIAAIYEPDKVKALLNLPADLSAWVALSFGYPSPTFRPAKMGGRKPLDVLVHRERW